MRSRWGGRAHDDGLYCRIAPHVRSAKRADERTKQRPAPIGKSIMPVKTKSARKSAVKKAPAPAGKARRTAASKSVRPAERPSQKSASKSPKKPALRPKSATAANRGADACPPDGEETG